MRDRPNKESAGEQYLRLAQACLEMVPSIQDGRGREALIEMARVWPLGRQLRAAQLDKLSRSRQGAASRATTTAASASGQVKMKTRS